MKIHVLNAFTYHKLHGASFFVCPKHTGSLGVSTNVLLESYSFLFRCLC